MFDRQVSTRILEAHANVKDLTLTEAKLNYIKGKMNDTESANDLLKMYFEFQTTAWQSLPEYGVSLFVVKFMNQRKEELLGVAFNRLMRMDMTTGDHIKTWRFNTMKVYRISHRDTKSPCRMLTR